MMKNILHKATIVRRITKDDLLKFIELSGDSNPIHLENSQQRAIVHGALLNAFVSRVIGTELPGPGSVVVQQSLNFPSICYVDDEVKISVELVENRKLIKVKFVCEVPERQKTVLYGDAKLVMTKQI